MDDQRMTCDRVDRDGLDTRYLAGRLSEAEAEVFEAHYFECDRCWALVQRGAEIRAAGPPAATARNPPSRLPGWSRWAWVPLAAAAAVALWIGTRRTDLSQRPGVDETARGVEGSTLKVTVISTGPELAAVWPAVGLAASYRVRLFDPNGTLLWERRIGDTTTVVARDSLAPGPDAATGAVFWQVQALDQTGAAVARSPLVEVPPSPRKP